MVPTPSGVPVKMTSPGLNGSTEDSSAISFGTEWTKSAVDAFCTTSSLRRQLHLQVVGVVEFVGGDQEGAGGAEPGKRLAHAHLRQLSEQLGGAFGEVLAQRQPRDIVPALFGADVKRSAAHHDYQLDLPVHGVSGQGDHAGGRGERRHILGEHHGPFRHLQTALGGMAAVVCADAEDLFRPRRRRLQLVG